MADTFTADQVRDALTGLMNGFTRGRASVLEEFVGAQSQRVDYLSEAAKGAAAVMKKDDPRLLALQARATAAAEIRDDLLADAQRLGRLPDLGDQESIVYGQIVGPDRKPASGLRIELSDVEKGFINLGTATTDTQGEFAIVFDEAVVKHIRDGKAELKLEVRNSRGTVLHTSQDRVTFRDGRAEYFEITLARTPRPAKPAPASADPGAVRSSSARPRRRPQ